jgi:hypothetical protein
MTSAEILIEIRAIKAALGAPVDDMERRCIACRPVVEAQLKLNELERKLSKEADDHA